MKYIVITAKHHDGFSMFGTKESDYNIVDATPYRKDPMKQLAEVSARHEIKLGLYYSLVDWHYPGAVKRTPSTKYGVQETILEAHHRYNVAQLKELLTGYGPLVELFFDMSKPTPEQSREYARTVRQLQPDCLVNGRVGNYQGDFLTMPDNTIPDIPISLPWEAPSTLYHWTEDEIPGWNNGWFNTWGYKRWIPRPPVDMQVKKQLGLMARIVSRGGNFLLNIGPTGLGEIIDYEQDVLRRMGRWLQANGEAVYDTRASPFKILLQGYCTRKPGKLYFLLDEWPAGGLFRIPGLKTRLSKAYLLSTRRALPFWRQGNDWLVELPAKLPAPHVTVFVAEYSGGLNIVDPLAVPDESGTITLDRRTEISRGVYSSLSYSSLVNDTNKYWDIRVPAAATHEVEMWYEKRKRTDAYVLAFGREKASAKLSEGSGRASFGEVHLSACDRLTVEMSHADPWTRNWYGDKSKKRLGVTVTRIVLRPVAR